MLPISRQCELLGLYRSSYYYSSQRDDSYNLELMRLIDEQFTRTPFYGVPKMNAWLRSVGHLVNVTSHIIIIHNCHIKLSYFSHSINRIR